MIIKVKEPQPEEYKYFREGQIVYTFFHLASNQNLTTWLLKERIISVAYETITDNGYLPILKPMSEIAGRRRKK